MHAYFARFAVLAMIAAASLCAGAPPVFTTKSFADAKAQSIKDHKLLILDSMADWCAPCKMMDKDTWVDDKVVKWVGDNAIALQFDVDKDKALATQLHIAAMPTVVILKDGKEFDRSVGYQSPQELLKWLEGARQGKTTSQAESERLAALRKKAYEPVTDKRGTHANIEARLAWARALSTRGEDVEATDEFVWLWENMNKEDSNFVGVRSSFMASDMQAIAMRHPGTRNRFTAMRDALESNLKAGTSTPDELSDWMTLNDVVGDNARTVAWYNRVKDDPLAKQDIHRNEFRLRQVFEWRQDWAGLASLSKDPVADVRGQLAMTQLTMRMAASQDLKLLQGANLEPMLDDIKHLYVGLLALHREEEADKVAALLLGAIDQAHPRRVLVAMALDAAQPRERHLKMLDEADEKDSAKQGEGSGESDVLRARLKRMLEEADIAAGKK